MRNDWKQIAASAGLVNAELGRVKIDVRRNVMRISLHLTEIPKEDTLNKAGAAFRKRFPACEVHLAVACPKLASAFAAEPAA